MKLGQMRLRNGSILMTGMLCLFGLAAASSQARVLDSTNGQRITVGPAGHAYTKEELAKKESGKSGKKQKKTTASESGPQEPAGKE